MKIKKWVIKKVMAVFLAFLLLVSSFSPYLLIAPAFSQVKAQEVIEVISPAPTAELTSTPAETPIPTPTIEVTPTSEPTVTPEPTPTQTPTPSQWTFEKVELNKEYTAPQNSEVKLTFTKLPSLAGNIKIEEITLSEEQIKQTGSLSDKAYDITSDMADGSFSYNLSLPIPKSSKGKAVEVKFAEELSNIGSAEKVDNTLTKTDTSVSVTSLDHFTIFVVVAPTPVNTDCSGAGVGIVGTDTCYNSIQAAIAAASSGNTINIAAGTYVGNLTVDKSLTLLGVGDDTIINGNINVTGDNVTIQSLKITNLNPHDGGVSDFGVKTTAGKDLTLESVTIDVLHNAVYMTGDSTTSDTGLVINNSTIKGYGAVYLNGAINSAGTKSAIVGINSTSLTGTTSYSGSYDDFSVLSTEGTNKVNFNFTGTSSVANEYTGGAQAKEYLIWFYDSSNITVTGTPTYTNASGGKISTEARFLSTGTYTNTVSGQDVARYVRDTTEFESALTSSETTPIVVGRYETAIVTTKDNTSNVALIIEDNTPVTIRTEDTFINNGSILIETGATLTNNGTLQSAVITGSFKYGQLLTTELTGLTNAGTPTFQWKRGAINIGTGSTYTLLEADIVSTINVTATTTGIPGTGIITSAETETITKADGPSAPVAPTLSSKTTTSVTLNANALNEFSKNAGTDWQDSNIFDGLTSATQYTFVTRVKATATANASTASIGTNISTDNTAPSFDPIADRTVSEDSSAQSIAVTNISPGPDSEASQTVTFSATSSNPPIIPNPTFSGSGSIRTLTYTPVANANGSATITVTANDGQSLNSTYSRTFSITINAVNDTPSFTKGADQNISEDAGAQTVSSWATSISKGPSDESGQTLAFSVTNNNNALFSAQPGISVIQTDMQNSLKYTPAANAYGSATVTVVLNDQGGASSATQTFTITVNPVNDTPTITLTSPNGGEIWAGGSIHNITWNASDVDVSNTLTVNLSYTTNGTDFTSIASGLTNSGTYTWNPVASLNSSTVTVRAIATDPSNATGTDLSNTNFTIDSTAPTGTIVINGGATYTNIRNVTLTLSAGVDLSGVTEMAFSNGSDYSDWEAYSTSKSLWTLSLNDGPKTVRVKFRDAAGNETSPGIPAYITVDTTKPVIASHDNITVEATSNAGATVSYTSPATSDAVDGTSIAVCLPASDTVFALGTTAVSCTKTDVAGNSATPTTFDITVRDTTLPVITRNGDASITLEIKTPYTDAGATATDIVGGNLTSSIVTVNPVNVNTASTYTITYNVKDAANNSATQVTRTVIIQDSIEDAFNKISSDLAGSPSYVANNLNDVTTDNITAFPNLYFEKSINGEKVGKLKFTAALDLSKTETQTFLKNLGTYMEANPGSMSFDATTQAGMKAAGAEIKMYGINALGYYGVASIIVKDDAGNILFEGDGGYPTLSDISYDASEEGTLIFRTSHFTQFELDQNQTTPDESGDATLSGDTTEVVITDPDQPVNITIADGTDNPTIDVSAFVSLVDGEQTGTLPEITIISDVADVVIPDGTKVTGPADWDGVIDAPTEGTPAGGNAPAGFSVGSTVISIGSDAGTLFFDTPVTIILPNVTGTVGYRPAGSDTWQEITNVCTGTYENPTGAVYPGECAINNGTDTKIVTYHFTSFGNLTANQTSSSGGGTTTAGAPVCNDTKPGSAPTLLSAIAGFNSVTLTWSRAVDPVSYYLMTFGTSAGSQTYGNPNVGNKDTTSYTVNGLSGGATYYFRVRAGNGCAPGDFSNEASAAPTGGFIEGVPVGFEAGVLGEATKSEEPTEESTPGAQGTALGAETKNGVINSWWWPWILLSLLPLGWVVYHYKKPRP